MNTTVANVLQHRQSDRSVGEGAHIRQPGYGVDVTATWMPGGDGVLALPSGRLIRGRGLMRPAPDGPDPEFALYVVASEPYGVGWEFRWVEWADFGLPSDPLALREALVDAWERAERERVEVGCMGGRGRTGTALACIAVLDGVPADQAVEYVRRHYHPDAVETVEQHRFVADFA
jgi:protein-tyrosine phosphatase